jgi:hypothetical protein
MENLTEKQTAFIEEIKERFQHEKWSVSSYPKYQDKQSTWIPFKYYLLDFAMKNNLYFLEKSNFVHVGKSHNICEFADTKLNQFLSEQPVPTSMVANEVQSNLN